MCIECVRKMCIESVGKMCIEYVEPTKSPFQIVINIYIFKKINFVW